MRHTLFGVGALVLMASAGCLSQAQRDFASRLEGKLAPDFELLSLNGDKVKLSQFRGKPVVLAFFAFG